MESIQQTLEEMMVMFQKRMTDFDAELQKSPTNASSPIASEFASFRVFITETLNNLQQQVQMLARNMDTMEMRARRKMLLLHGVPEVAKEDTALAVTNVIKDNIKVNDFSSQSIKRCHRLGRSTDNKKPRPILFKLRDVAIRDELWFAKTKLKGSGITMSEFLTKGRHDVFMAAREKFGVSKCWTQEGMVYVLGADAKRARVFTIQDLDRLGNASKAKKPVAAETVTTRSKRAANSNKK